MNSNRPHSLPALARVFFFLAIALIAGRAGAADWFVAAGDKAPGQGTRAMPFRDPWLALRIAEPGDVIHVAAGTYTGRYDRSSWEIVRPDITIRGGYSPDFSSRNPWKTPSILAVDPNCEAVREPNLISGRGDHSGLVLDGLAFDNGGRNSYGDTPNSALRGSPVADGFIATFRSPVTIRNCIFANGGAGGIDLGGEGSRFENNLVINVVGLSMLALRDSNTGNRQPIIVKGNTFAFAHDDGDPPLGLGADKASGIRVQCAASIESNAFIACGNFGISIFAKPDRVAVDRNLFYLSPHMNVAKRVAGDESAVSGSNMDELEDLGLKSAAKNAARDPGLSGLKSEWMDAVTRWMLISYAHPPRDALAALRSTANLTPLAAPAPATKPAPKDPDSPERLLPGTREPRVIEDSPEAGAFAPYIPIADCLAFTLKDADHGAHPIDLKVELAREEKEEKPAAPFTYRPVTWADFARPDPALSNQRIELRAGLGGEINSFFLTDITREKYIGFQTYPLGQGAPDQNFQFFARRNSLPARQYEDASKYTSQRDVEDAYLLRGICRTDTNHRQKAALIIESIVPAPAEPVPTQRPRGRDWFVRANSSGGDGSRDKPFRDPFQALDKAEGGDTIHVGAGDYFGKLRSGNWKLTVRNLTLLGGYDATFSSRDPWKNPSRLAYVETENTKGKHTGALLESGEPSDGLVLDGFVFDSASLNVYLPTGALDPAHSISRLVVDLRAGRDPITVRNCTFVNACGNAVSLRAPAGTFENNIVLNTSGYAVLIGADGRGPWFIRNNTLLFAADPSGRAGTGLSSAGSLLVLSGRAKAVAESNLFAFADNYALRCTLPQPNVSISGNIFAATNYCPLTDCRMLYAFDNNWDRRTSDADFALVRDNSLALPNALRIDRTYAEAALTRATNLPSRRAPDDWKRIAQAVGVTIEPPAAATTATTAPAEKPTASAKEPSIDDLMADLKKIKDELPKEQPTTGPPYCPAYDWRKALDLAQDASTANAIGARRLKLEVAAATHSPTTQPQRDYQLITFAQIDESRDPFNDKPVELIARPPRSVGAGGFFPADLPKDQYTGYILSSPEGNSRLPVAAFIRNDTAAAKRMNNSTERDTLRVRGTAKVLPAYRGLILIVDSVTAE